MYWGVEIDFLSLVPVKSLYAVFNERALPHDDARTHKETKILILWLANWCHDVMCKRSSLAVLFVIEAHTQEE